MGGPYGSDNRYTDNMAAELVVKNRLSTRRNDWLQEWNKVPQETYNAKLRRVAWVDVQQTRRGDRQ